ncbi:hypothetical protein O6H91_20G023300 [Diphasiastrum complanatum]|nr:hypothetical protein O6H91_20G023300 [Diphasiastrum complanatum]
MPADASALADHQECKQTGRRSVEVKNVLCEMNESIEVGGFASEIGELISGLERKIEHSKDLTFFSVDTPLFPTYIAGSDRVASIGNSMVDQLHSNEQIESISSNAEIVSSRDSTARSTILSPATMHTDRNEIYLRDRIPRPCNLSIGEKQITREDVLSNKSLQSAALLRDEEDGQTVRLLERGRSEQLNSLKKSQNEVAPGWRKPPRPPRLTKHEANSTLCKSISDASHAYRVKKFERLHGKKKMKAGGRSPNLTLFLALIFTFCFCLLIAKSSR